jgi:hypothetical protein
MSNLLAEAAIKKNLAYVPPPFLAAANSDVASTWATLLDARPGTAPAPAAALPKPSPPPSTPSAGARPSTPTTAAPRFLGTAPRRPCSAHPAGNAPPSAHVAPRQPGPRTQTPSPSPPRAPSSVAVRSTGLACSTAPPAPQQATAHTSAPALSSVPSASPCQDNVRTAPSTPPLSPTASSSPQPWQTSQSTSAGRASPLPRLRSPHWVPRPRHPPLAPLVPPTAISAPRAHHRPRATQRHYKLHTLMQTNSP